MKKNQTRRALFMSALSLLLCVSMLVGTTFAWFTDSVASANNIIKSGNLDIELEYWDGDSWENVAGKSDILTNTLWEPGVTEIAYLRVANAGSLALKYQLGINIVSETAGVNQAGDEFKLSDYINFGVVESKTFVTYENREDAVAAALTGAKPLNAGYTKANELYPANNIPVDVENAASELYLALVVYMPETVGNEANYKTGTAAPTINLGINVVATQVEAEFDSFGDDYDKDAWGEGFDVYTEQDLNAAIANGETKIVLMGDIAVSEQILIPEGAKITMNLNGKTLSSATGTVIRNEGALTLVGKGTVESAGQAYAIRVQQGTMIIDSADINVKGAFGAVSIFNGADVTINGGNFNAEGINGMTSHTVYVSNSTLTVNGGTFDSGYSSEGIDTICGSKSTITLNDGTFYASELGESFFLKNVTSVKGGTYQYKPANIADGYKAVENDGKYVVVPENVDSVVTTAADLATAIAKGGVVSVMADIDVGNSWTSVKPNGELTILGNENTITNLNLPLLTGGVSSKVTIKGLTIADSNVAPAAYENGLGSGAFIPYVDAYGNVTFEECHLLNSTVTGNERAGGFIGYTSGQSITIKNSSVEGCEITAVGGAGGLVGYSQSETVIENSSVKDSELTATEDRLGTKAALAGAVIGTVNDDTTLTKVTVSNNTVSNNNALPVYSDCIGRKVSGNLTIDGKTVASSAADITAGGDFVLTGDIQNNSAFTNDTSIDLNGKTFEATGTVNLTGNADLTMTNGDYVVNGTYGHIDVRPDSAEGSTLLFENVDFSYNKLNKTYGPSTNRLGSVVEICATAADAKSVVVFRNCTFNNAQVLIEGMSGKTGIVDVTFENCTFNALTSSAPIKVDNYVTGKVTVTGCTFNLECTSSVASAISVSSSTSTVIELIASNNTINATAATASGEDGTVEQVKVNGTPANIKFISAYDNATVTETGTVKSGIAK